MSNNTTTQYPTQIPPPPAPGAVSLPTSPPTTSVQKRARSKRISTKLKVKGAILAGLLVVGAIAAYGTTRAGELSAGDCFEATTATEVALVTDQDCSGLHDAQVVGTYELTGRYPGAAAVEEEALSRCTDIAASAIRDIDALPLDTQVGVFYPQSALGGQTVVCYVQSASGLYGSIV